MGADFGYETWLLQEKFLSFESTCMEVSQKHVTGFVEDGWHLPYQNRLMSWVCGDGREIKFFQVGENEKKKRKRESIWDIPRPQILNPAPLMPVVHAESRPPNLIATWFLIPGVLSPEMNCVPIWTQDPANRFQDDVGLAFKLLSSCIAGSFLAVKLLCWQLACPSFPARMRPSSPPHCTLLAIISLWY